MDIKGIAAASHYLKPLSSPAEAEPSLHATQPPVANASDTVTLSAEAQKMQDATQQQPPLESYAIPGWLAEYGTVLSGKLGTPASESTTPGRELAKVPEESRKAFGAVVRTAYEHVLQENGIDTREDHYRLLIEDLGKSEDIHQQFLAKLADHPEFASLLKTS